MIDGKQLEELFTHSGEEWLRTNVGRCSKAQAFGLGVEGWWQTELALFVRDVLHSAHPSLAVEREVDPEKYGLNPVGKRRGIDMVVTRADDHTKWIDKNAADPRLWIEMKFGGHFLRADFQTKIRCDLDKIQQLKLRPQDIGLVASWAPVRVHEDADRSLDPFASNLPRPDHRMQALEHSYSDWTTWPREQPYASVVHHFAVWRAEPSLSEAPAQTC